LVNKEKKTMPPYDGLVLALNKREQDLSSSNPWIGAGSAISKANLTNPNAKWYENLILALGGGMVGGAMDAYGESQVSDQLVQDRTSLLGRQPGQIPDWATPYQGYLVNDDLARVAEVQKAKQDGAIKIAERNQAIADSFEKKGYNYNPETQQIEPIPGVLATQPPKLINSGGSVYTWPTSGQQAVTTPEPPKDNWNMSSQLDWTGEGGQGDVTMPVDAPVAAPRAASQDPVERLGYVKLGPVKPPTSGNPNAIELDLYKRQTEAQKALTAFDSLDKTLSQFEPILGDKEELAGALLRNGAAKFSPNSDSAQVERELKGVIAIALKPNFPGNISDTEREYMQQVLGDQIGVSIPTLRQIAQSMKSRMIEGLDASRQNVVDSGIRMRLQPLGKGSTGAPPPPPGPAPKNKRWKWVPN
jgi:hypothetical protein